MKILKPIMAFDVELDDYEVSTLRKTWEILFDLQQEMKSNHCTEISCDNDIDDDVIITIDTLSTLRYHLNDLMNIKEIH